MNPDHPVNMTAYENLPF